MRAKRYYTQEQIDACKKYVDEQIAIMKKYDSDPNLSQARYDRLVSDVLKALPKKGTTNET